MYKSSAQQVKKAWEGEFQKTPNFTDFDWLDIVLRRIGNISVKSVILQGFRE